MITGLTNPGISQLIDSFAPGNNPFSDLSANPKPGRGFNPHAPVGGDQVELSPEANVLYQHTRAQFELNYQCLRYSSGQEGDSYQQVTFSLKGSFEFIKAASGQEPSAAGEVDSSSLMEKLQDLFSPEKTAKRILDFALSQYDKAGGDDTEAARQDFADYIGAALQKGFDTALSMLGKIADNIQAGIDKTHALVFQGLDDFVANGQADSPSETSDAANTYAQFWQASIQMRYSSLNIYRYNRNGALEAPPAAEDANQAIDAVA